MEDRISKKPDGAKSSQLAEKMMELGLSANLIAVKAFGGIFRIAPAISVSELEDKTALEIIEKAFSSVYDK